jgi:hypothetical protein
MLLVTKLESVTLTDSNLPIFVINTNGQTIVDEPRITAQLGVIYNGEGLRNYLTDPFNNYNGQIAIEIRGSSSQSYPKKSYRFELQNDLGEDTSVALVDLPKEADWVLYAPYADPSYSEPSDDFTMLRNALAYDLSNDMGRYASRVRFCELIINNDYKGLYLLLENIKRDKNRVNIAKMTPADTVGEDLTGGYIIKIDRVDNTSTDGWYSTNGVFYGYEYPKIDEITSHQKKYIRQYLNGFENALKGTQPSDPLTGYPAYIDLDSFVDHFLLNEFCRNVDAYRLSSFYHKDKNGKLCAGPIWDFNLTFGKAWYASYKDIYIHWEVDHDTYLPNDSPKVPFWWKKLSRQAGFATRAAERWTELRTGLLDIDSLNSRIDSMAEYIAEARTRNSARWPAMGDAIVYASEIVYLKNWIRNRITWIDANIGSLNAIQTVPDADLPAEFSLRQNYPNPFNAETRIQFAIPEAVHVKLEIVSCKGQRVAKLVDDTLASGSYEIRWNAGRVAAGLYFIYFRAGDFKAVRKLTLLK